MHRSQRDPRPGAPRSGGGLQVRASVGIARVHFRESGGEMEKGAGEGMR
jgi:hypothetical protein